MNREDELLQALSEFLKAAKGLFDPSAMVGGYPSYFKLKQLREHITKTEDFLRSSFTGEDEQHAS